MSYKRNIKRSFASDFSRDAREGHLIERNNLESSVCKHFEYCNVAKITGKNCADYENCRTYKFKEKYKL